MKDDEIWWRNAQTRRSGGGSGGTGGTGGFTGSITSRSRSGGSVGRRGNQMKQLQETPLTEKEKSFGEEREVSTSKEERLVVKRRMSKHNPQR